MCVWPTFFTGMISPYSSHIAAKLYSVARALWVTTGMRIFSRSARSWICLWKCRETISLAASVRATSTSSTMPKSVLWMASGQAK